jgi:hypothetical protein
MANVNRLKVRWNGAGVVGEGLSVLYFRSAATTVAPVLSFFSSIANKFPAEVSWTVPGEGDVIDEATGTIVSGWALPGGGVQPASGTDSRFSLGVGARAVFGTASVVAGRRVRGSLFLVPLEGYCYANDGTLDATNASQIQTALNTLQATDTLVVWSRPVPGGRAGSFHTITSMTIPDKVSWLRTRRT